MPLFSRQRPKRPLIIGMIHLLPLPGAPEWGGDMAAIARAALSDAATYRQLGIDAILVENMHDLPYLKGRVAPETTAAMARVAWEIKAASPGIPVGVQLLAAANREALGVAVAANLDFIRAEGFAYAHVADEGWIDACAGPLIRARAAMGSRHIEILADIKKKHASHAITGDLSLPEIAEGTHFCAADGLIVTGSTTGSPPSAQALEAVRHKTPLPTLVGSGITAENLSRFSTADGWIIGSYFKRDGDWRQPVDGDRIRALMKAAGR